MNKNLRFVLTTLSTGLLTTAAMAQDPMISAPSLVPSPAMVGGTITMSVDFTNVNGLPVPNVPGDPMYINFSLNKAKPLFNPDNTPVVTGSGAAYFTWSAACLSNCTDADTTNDIWVVTGTQSQTVPGFTDITQPAPGGPIYIQARVIAASTIAQSNAFNGSGFNANIAPGGGGDVQNGPGSNNQSNYTFTNGNLPVKFLRFDARPDHNNVVVSWSTALEQNNDRFEIEFSTDGSRFVKAGTVKGKGNSQLMSEYTFNHKDIVLQTKAPVLYYRLRQVDLDGRYEYSKVAAVNLKHVAGTINISPNPLRQGTELKITADKLAEISVYNATGIKVWSQQYKGGQQATVPTGNLSAGVYLIRINGSYTSKFVVQ